MKEEGEEGAQDGEVARTDGGVAVEKKLDTVEQKECAAGRLELECGAGVVRDGRGLLGDVGVDAEDGSVGVVGGVEDVVGGVEQDGERHDDGWSRDQGDIRERINTAIERPDHHEQTQRRCVRIRAGETLQPRPAPDHLPQHRQLQASTRTRTRTGEPVPRPLPSSIALRLPSSPRLQEDILHREIKIGYQRRRTRGPVRRR